MLDQLDGFVNTSRKSGSLEIKAGSYTDAEWSSTKEYLLVVGDSVNKNLLKFVENTDFEHVQNLTFPASGGDVSSRLLCPAVETGAILSQAAAALLKEQLQRKERRQMAREAYSAAADVDAAATA